MTVSAVARLGMVMPSRGRAVLVLVLLTLSYTCSFADRTMLGVLQEPIRKELLLSDFQLGLLGGPTFALFYAVFALPLSRLAERYHRAVVLGLCLVAWSGMTMLCGVAQSYPQLLACRMGVGIGEAGGNPTSHSIITDYFAPAKRAIALAVYSVGAPAGAFLGAFGAGTIAGLWGWRVSFFLLGVPGINLAAVIMLTVREMPRGGRDDHGDETGPLVPFVAVIRALLGRPDFRHLAIGASYIVIGGFAVNLFLGSFLIRCFGLPLGKVGAVMGLVTGAAAGIGTLLGGVLIDRFARDDARFYVWIPAGFAALAAPLHAMAFMSESVNSVVAFLGPGTIAVYIYFAPAFALTHHMVQPRMRATAAAFLFFIINLVGLGLGPPLVGYVSDILAHQTFFAATGSSFAACAASAGDPVLKSNCDTAIANGLRWTLAASSVTFLLAGIHFWFAGRRMGRHAPSQLHKTTVIRTA